MKRLLGLKNPPGLMEEDPEASKGLEGGQGASRVLGMQSRPCGGCGTSSQPLGWAP